jgi:hypothetical protein
VWAWASQLKYRTLPPVCFKTGMPADSWYRVRFATAPRWARVVFPLVVFMVLMLSLCMGLIFMPFALVLMVVGMMVGQVLVRLVLSQRASGWLPLRRAVAIRLRILWAAQYALLAMGIAAIVSVVHQGTAGTVHGRTLLELGGGLILVAAVVTLIYVFLAPRAEVRTSPYENVVVFRNAHRDFAAAVAAAQHSAAPAVVAPPFPYPPHYAGR